MTRTPIRTYAELQAYLEQVAIAHNDLVAHIEHLQDRLLLLERTAARVDEPGESREAVTDAG